MVVLYVRSDLGIDFAFERENLLSGVAANAVEYHMAYFRFFRRYHDLPCEEVDVLGRPLRIEPS